MLGKECQDKITGFKGVAFGFSRYLTGCDQICLKPKVDDNGKMQKGEWFDKEQLVIIGEGIAKEEVSDAKKPGGPQPDNQPM